MELSTAVLIVGVIASLCGTSVAIAHYWFKAEVAKYGVREK